jgi:hypothetical protein
MINSASPVGIKDLHTTGFNPLRCNICQEHRKLDGKMTCGDQECVKRFFEHCVKPDTSEVRILK